ncbi:hypothetical protein BD779DRAFT_1411402, partial [Infundibulicybe gibba]
SGSRNRSACALCLGRSPHATGSCRLANIWSGEPARCYRGDGNRIYNPSRVSLCLRWQLNCGCSDTTHDSTHECSGCGARAHGAQLCPLAE